MTQLSLEVDKFCCPLLLMLTLSCTPFPLPHLSVSVSPCPVYLALSSLPFSLLLLSLVLFLSQLLLSLSLGRGNLLLSLSLSTSNHPSVYPSTNQASKRPSDQATIHPTAYLLNLCTSLRRCRRFGKLHFDWPASSLAVNYISPTPKRGRRRQRGSCACDCNLH